MEELKGLDKVATGKNIKRLMRKSGKDTFALMVGLHLTSASTIYSWTQGKFVPNAESLVKLAQLFDCTVDEILVLEEEND